MQVLVKKRQNLFTFSISPAQKVDIGKLIIMIGLTIVLLGLILKYAPWLLSWFGKLPGDINIETSNTRIFIPITSMVIVSILLTLMANLWLRK